MPTMVFRPAVGVSLDHFLRAVSDPRFYRVNWNTGLYENGHASMPKRMESTVSEFELVENRPQFAFDKVAFAKRSAVP